MYGSRRRVRLKIRHLTPLDGCACAFEEWVYRGRKGPKSHELAHLFYCTEMLCQALAHLKED